MEKKFNFDLFKLKLHLHCCGAGASNFPYNFSRESNTQQLRGVVHNANFKVVETL